MSKHTLGPLVVIGGRHTPEIRKGTNTIARMHATSDGDMHANAALFAASPTMYEMLKAEYDSHRGFQTLPLGYPAERAERITAIVKSVEGDSK